MGSVEALAFRMSETLELEEDVLSEPEDEASDCMVWEDNDRNNELFSANIGPLGEIGGSKRPPGR